MTRIRSHSTRRRQGHFFDAVGVCVLCGLCNDDACCARVVDPCDHNIILRTKLTTRGLIAKFREEGRL